MSASNPIAVEVNPTSVYVRFNASEGTFQLYDSLTKTKTEEPTFKAAIFDGDLAQVGGYFQKDAMKINIWSNVKFRHQTEVISVYGNKDLMFTGTYKELAQAKKEGKTFKAAGIDVPATECKFVKILMGVMADGRVVQIDLKGSSLGGYFDKITELNKAGKTIDDMPIITLSKGKKEKNGGVTYHALVVDLAPAPTPKAKEMLIEKDKMWQTYYTSRMNELVAVHAPTDEPTHEGVTDETADIDVMLAGDDDMPF